MGALRLAGASRVEAEDCAQEALTRVLVHWPRVRRGSNPAGYAYRAAFRILRRSRQRRLPVLGRPQQSPPPDDQVVLAAAVQAALAGLSRRQRECAVLVFYVGWSTDEVAGILGIRPPTVRVHLHAARMTLRAQEVEPDG